MVKEEIIKVMKSKKSLVVILYLTILAIVDFAIYYHDSLSFTQKVHPAFASTLSASSNFICYALLFWVLPISLMLLYCDKYAIEKNNSLTNIYISKVGRRTFFLSKMFVSFITAFIFMLIPIVINFALNCVFHHSGTSFYGLEDWNIETAGIFLYNCIKHPYIAYFCYMIVAAMLFGLLGVLCQSISFIFCDNRVTYIVSLAIWLLFWSMDYNFSMITQPFCEYNYTHGFKVFLMFGSIVLIFFVVAYINSVVKKDEI